jgi:hypothetical protein
VPSGQKAASCKCGGNNEEILVPLLSKGKIRTSLPDPENIRDFVVRQLEKVDL